MVQAAPGILIHAGYHKTATTWLQYAYFPSLADVDLPFKRKDITKILVQPHPFTFDARTARNAIMDHLKNHQGRAIVISEERFSGNPANGGIDAFQMVDRIAATLPEAKVWLNLREQAAMIASTYKQFIKIGGTCDLDRFLAGNRHHKQFPYFTPEHFDYLPLVKRFEDRLGRDRVLVTLYEEFCHDRDAVLEQVGRHGGFRHDPQAGMAAERHNVSFSDRSVRIMRRLNGLLVPRAAHEHFRPLVRLPGQWNLRRLLRFSDRILGPGRATLQPRIAAALGDRFAASNRALGRHLGKDLSRWGYVCEDL